MRGTCAAYFQNEDDVDEHLGRIAAACQDKPLGAPVWISNKRRVTHPPGIGFVEFEDDVLGSGALLVDRRQRDERVLSIALSNPSIHISGHGKHRAKQRVGRHFPDESTLYTWLKATVDYAVRTSQLHTDPPAWTHARGCGTKLGWVIRDIGDDQVAILVGEAKREHDRSPYTIVTVLSRSHAWQRWRYVINRWRGIIWLALLRLTRQTRAHRGARRQAKRAA